MSIFDNVNPHLLDAAIAVQDMTVKALKLALPNEPIEQLINDHIFEIANNLFTDIAYEVKENDFLLLALICVVLNRVFDSHKENRINDESSAVWLLSAIHNLKLSKTTAMADAAIELINQEFYRRGE